MSVEYTHKQKSGPEKRRHHIAALDTTVTGSQVGDVANTIADVASDASKTVGVLSAVVMGAASVYDMYEAIKKRIHTSKLNTALKLLSYIGLIAVAGVLAFGVFLAPVVLLPAQMIGNAIALFRRLVSLGRAIHGGHRIENLIAQKQEKLDVILEHHEKNPVHEEKVNELRSDIFALLVSALENPSLTPAEKEKLQKQRDSLQSALPELASWDKAETLLVAEALLKHQVGKRRWRVFQVVMQAATLVGCGLLFAFPLAGAVVIIVAAVIAVIGVFVRHRSLIMRGLKEAVTGLKEDIVRNARQIWDAIKNTFRPSLKLNAEAEEKQSLLVDDKPVVMPIGAVSTETKTYAPPSVSGLHAVHDQLDASLKKIVEHPSGVVAPKEASTDSVPPTHPH